MIRKAISAIQKRATAPIATSTRRLRGHLQVTLNANGPITIAVRESIIIIKNPAALPRILGGSPARPRRLVVIRPTAQNHAHARPCTSCTRTSAAFTRRCASPPTRRGTPSYRRNAPLAAVYRVGVSSRSAACVRPRARATSAAVVPSGLLTVGSAPFASSSFTISAATCSSSGK